MKTELIEPQPEHDWSKPMLYVNEDFMIYVMSSGAHSGDFFTGQCIATGWSSNYAGEISTEWFKRDFTPIRTPKTVKFDPQ
jgi:hypothetical protein